MSLEDKIDAIEVAVMRLHQMLQHVPQISFTVKQALEDFIGNMSEIDDECEWDEIECEPVAWMICGYQGVPHSVYLCKEEAIARAEGDRIVPLYDLQRDEEGLDDE